MKFSSRWPLCRGHLSVSRRMLEACVASCCLVPCLVPCLARAAGGEVLRWSDALQSGRAGFDPGEATRREMQSLERLLLAPHLWRADAQRACWNPATSVRAGLELDYRRTSYSDLETPELQLERRSLALSASAQGASCVWRVPDTTLWLEAGPTLDVFPAGEATLLALGVPTLATLQVGPQRRLILATALTPGLLAVGAALGLGGTLEGSLAWLEPRGPHLLGTRLRLTGIRYAASGPAAETTPPDDGVDESTSSRALSRSRALALEALYTRRTRQAIQTLLVFTGRLRQDATAEPSDPIQRGAEAVLRVGVQATLEQNTALGLGSTLGLERGVVQDAPGTRETLQGSAGLYGWFRTRGGPFEVRGSLGLLGHGLQDSADPTAEVAGLRGWATVGVGGWF